MRINIISGDSIFSGMLALELSRRGFDAVTSSDASGASLIVLDIDTTENSFDLPCITFSCEKEADLKRPFSISELADLIDVQIPETVKIKPDSAEHPVFHPDENSVMISGNTVHLTKQEYLLLELLYKNLGKTVSKDNIKNYVWGSLGNDNRLRVYVKYIREKIEPIYKKRIFHSVRGCGYTMNID